MPLKFGDLTAKADALQAAKERQQIERKIATAEECLSRCKTIPPAEAQIREYPPIIQRLGIEACRAANMRIRTGRTL